MVWLVEDVAGVVSNRNDCPHSRSRIAHRPAQAIRMKYHVFGGGTMARATELAPSSVTARADPISDSFVQLALAAHKPLQTVTFQPSEAIRVVGLGRRSLLPEGLAQSQITVRFKKVDEILAFILCPVRQARGTSFDEKDSPSLTWIKLNHIKSLPMPVRY